MSTSVKFPKELVNALKQQSPTLSRRQFIQSSGALVLSCSLGSMPQQLFAQGSTTEVYPVPDFRQLDTWIVIHPDNTASFFVGKTDGGQGTGTAFRQMMCDELDMSYEQTRLIMGSTDSTPDQGGSGGSDGVEIDGWPMRRTAAEARRVLIDLGSDHLGIPRNQLETGEGKIWVRSDPSKSVNYAQLIGGRRFDVALTGRNVNATTGMAEVKPSNEYKVVGQSIPRYDIPAKVDGSLTWAVDVKLPNMVHGRNVRPPVAGATVQSIDESSVASIPGFIRVVSRGNYVAVVCEREEQAIRAARELVVDWRSPSEAPFPNSDDLFDYMREVEPTSVTSTTTIGDPVSAFSQAKQIITADYDIPFQGHTAIGPAHALADPSNNQMTVYSNDMKTYGLRRGVAEFLAMPLDKVRVVYMDGPQVYGRTAADDVGFEAAYLAKELGVPVRVQWMRHEETAWDTKGPAYAIKLRGAIDNEGQLTAIDYDARAADYNHLGYNEADTVLIAQLMGIRPPLPAEGAARTPSNHYAIENQQITAKVVSLPMIWETPLRTGNLRDPNGPQITFAFESFIDEVAEQTSTDPVELRMQLLAKSSEDDRLLTTRSLATIRAAAESYKWDTRPSPNLDSTTGANVIATGRGISYTYRNATVVAVIAEVEVNRESGKIWARRIVCAHDCGLVINPQSLVQTVECGVLHGLSRALTEEVKFDSEKVTSVDWVSHPSLRHSDTPESVEVVIVNGDPNPERKDLKPYGAGEACHKPVIAAVANAVFDATGLRLRSVPFRADKVLRGLSEMS